MTTTPKVLVTSSGTGSAVNAIRALRLAELPLEVIATDVDPSAPGLFLADRHYVLPRYNSPEFASKLFEIPQKEGSEVLCLPTFSEEIAWFSKNATLLEENGVRTFLPANQSVITCDNKWLFWSFAKSIELSVPEIFFCTGALEPSIAELPYPLFAKQTVGSGSRFATIVRSPEELLFHSSHQKNILVQRYIEGYEVTVDVFCLNDGRLNAASARKRVAVKSGQSVKGVTIPVEPFLPSIERACSKLALRGVSNFQFIVSENHPVLIEVNPRLAAGGLMLSVHAGINTPVLCVQEMLERTDNSPALKRGKEGLCMTKFWNEVVYNN